MKVIVIIPAAGLGTRMAPAGKKAVASKQFFEINGTPIIIHTLRVFARNKQVNQIVVALRKNEMEQFSRQLEKEKIAAKVEMVERLGESVWVVMGSTRNIKITTPADLELAEFLMKQAR